MWVPPEIQDPVLLHQPTRRSVGYYGAVRLRDGKLFFRRETDKFNALTCWKFLQHLKGASTRSGRRVTVIVDNARYHHASLHRDWRDEHALHFALDYLPAYSPELNPIERLWKLTRRRCLHNRYFAHLDDVIKAVEKEFAAWTKPNSILRRLCAITYDVTYNNPVVSSSQSFTWLRCASFENIWLA